MATAGPGDRAAGLVTGAGVAAGVEAVGGGACGIDGVGAGGTDGGAEDGGAEDGGTEDGAVEGGKGAAQPAATAIVNARLKRGASLRQLQSSLPSRCPAMWLLLLEAALALGLFVFIVWWTMFHRPPRKPPADDV